MSIPGSPHQFEALLREGDIQVEGRFVYGSNHTFLANVSWLGQSTQAVYKPSHGERPLWDFPYGTLASREVAAYLVSESLGWDLIPTTVLRPDGPGGGGSLQRFVQADPEITYFSLPESEVELLKPIAAFDALINNADRKGGHILRDESGHLWSIDHGVCFHDQPKLRSVIWDFAGQPLPSHLLHDMEQFSSDVDCPPLHDQMRHLLSLVEHEALAQRARDLVKQGTFPAPGPGRPYPWPLV